MILKILTLIMSRNKPHHRERNGNMTREREKEREREREGGREGGRGREREM